MFVRINTDYSISLLVTDISGNRITTDSPTVAIRDVQNNTYWNGIAWQPTMANIVMNHIANGVYNSVFVPSSVGIYEITCQSEIYNITRIESIEVYDDTIAKYDWKVNTTFTVSFSKLSELDNPVASVCKEAPHLFWSGTEWTATEIKIPMNLLIGGVFICQFTPDEAGEYVVNVNSQNGQEILYAINASVEADADSILPVAINNYNFKSQDGSDSTLVDESQIAVNTVSVTCFDTNTQLVVSKATSNIKGEWNMLIKPGKYFFVFAKDGYISVSFERSVM